MYISVRAGRSLETPRPDDGSAWTPNMSACMNRLHLCFASRKIPRVPRASSHTGAHVMPCYNMSYLMGHHSRQLVLVVD